MLEVETTGQRGYVTTRSGQNVLEMKRLRGQYQISKTKRVSAVQLVIN